MSSTVLDAKPQTSALILPEQRVLAVNDLSVRFATSERTVDAVKNLSFHVDRGETLAIVGESGSGKSVTSLALMRLVEHGGGRIINGSMAFRRRGGQVLDLAQARDATMREVRGADIAMIFQEPMTSLNPVFTAGDQIAESIRVHQGKSAAAARAEALRMLELVRIPEAKNVLDRYPHQLSGGMRQRVMIAMALSCKPSLLIADEPTTALDVTIQAQILHLLREIQQRLGTSIVLITHDLGVVAQMCQRVIVMYAGRKVEEGSVDDILDRAQHPYTQALIRSLPDFADGQDHTARLAELPGIVPVMTPESRGCAFAARCPEAQPRCSEQAPPAADAGSRHRVWCWARAAEPAPAALTA